MKKRKHYQQIFRYCLLSIILILLVSTTGESLGFAASTGDDPVFVAVTMDEDMAVIDNDLLSASARTAARNKKLDSSLNRLATASDRSVGETAALAESLGAKMSDKLIQVHITTSSADLTAALQAVAASGGEATVSALDESTIQAWLPVASLESITAYDSIYFVRLPMYAELMGDMRVGDSDTEALDDMNVDAWHAADIKGDGVKVAIIDGGFIGYEALLGTDLPATVTAKNFTDFEADPGDVGTDTEHGTACAEIIHDIAPEADLYLIKIATNLDLQEAVTYAIAQGVDIISTSLGWYNLTPGDGTGEFEDLADQARDAGILWLTAASNDRQAHWGGLFNDPDDDKFLNYSGTDEINSFSPGGDQVYLIPAGIRMSVYLRWDDWTDVDQDYDLYLYRNIYSGGAFQGWSGVASSEDLQNGIGGQTPTEYISYLTVSTQAAYGFAVSKWDSDRDVNFEIFAPKITELKHMVYQRSLGNLADAPSALTVAALDVDDPYPQEDYSSEGPTNGPGGALTGGDIKPDLSGFANVSTESYGDTPFNGTSSATPHVSGAAALVLCANPTYSPDNIQDYLEDKAVDMGTSGMDTIYGYGRVRLGNLSSVDEYFNYLPLFIK